MCFQRVQITVNITDESSTYCPTIRVVSFVYNYFDPWYISSVSACDLGNWLVEGGRVTSAGRWVAINRVLED